MTENEIARIVVDSSLRAHRALGPGLLESVYGAALSYELVSRGLQIERQRGIAVEYCGVRLDIGFRADIIVNRAVILEIKAVEGVLPVHRKQLLTYLKLTGCRLGLLINFNSELIRDGIWRVVNGMPD
jgi:GxxExxY protein